MELRITTLMASGDHREALELMASEYGDDVARFCAAMVGSPAEGEELLQDALIEAYGAMGRFGGDSSARGWLFGIARRICIRHLRRRDRRRNLLLRWFVPESKVAPEPPQDPVEASENRAALTSALGSLKPGVRDAVLLRYQAGLDGVEVASALGISHAAARKRISLGIQALRTSLRPLLMMTATEHTENVDESMSARLATRLVRS